MSCTLYFNGQLYKRYRNRYRLQYRIFRLVVDYYDEYYRSIRYAQFFEGAATLPRVKLQDLTLVMGSMWQTSLNSPEINISVVADDGSEVSDLCEYDKTRSIAFLSLVCDNYPEKNVFYLYQMRQAYINHMMDLSPNKCICM